MLEFLGGDGQMSTLWLETVFVSDIVDGVGDAIGADIGERALDNDAFVVSSNVIQLSGGFNDGLVVEFGSGDEAFGSDI